MPFVIVALTIFVAPLLAYCLAMSTSDDCSTNNQPQYEYRQDNQQSDKDFIEIDGTIYYKSNGGSNND